MYKGALLVAALACELSQKSPTFHQFFAPFFQWKFVWMAANLCTLSWEMERDTLSGHILSFKIARIKTKKSIVIGEISFLFLAGSTMPSCDNAMN